MRRTTRPILIGLASLIGVLILLILNGIGGDATTTVPAIDLDRTISNESVTTSSVPVSGVAVVPPPTVLLDPFDDEADDLEGVDRTDNRTGRRPGSTTRPQSDDDSDSIDDLDDIDPTTTVEHDDDPADAPDPGDDGNG